MAVAASVKGSQVSALKLRARLRNILPKPPGDNVPRALNDELHRWRINSHVRSRTDPEGGVILDVRTGIFHSLNATGVVVWEALTQSSDNGLDPRRLLEAITVTFGPQPCIADDLQTLLESLEQKGLVQRSAANAFDDLDHSSQEVASRSESESNVSCRAKKLEAVVDPKQSYCNIPTGYREGRPSYLWTCAALACFAAAHIVLRIGGFGRLHQSLRWLSSKRPVNGVSAENISNVCFAVNKAATYYPQRSWCLQRAAVTFSLLRLGGIPAELVIGCERVPFYSHAWVEIHRTVVNDNPAVKSRYPELDRIQCE